MSDSIIQIKRSTTQDTPSSLANGELAYSYSSNSLFIGNPNGDLFKVLDTGSVGSKLSHANGTLTNSAALVTNATGYVDNIKTLNITTDGTQTANIINAVNITAGDLSGLPAEVNQDIAGSGTASAEINASHAAVITAKSTLIAN